MFADGVSRVLGVRGVAVCALLFVSSVPLKPAHAQSTKPCVATERAYVNVSGGWVTVRQPVRFFPHGGTVLMEQALPVLDEVAQVIDEQRPSRVIVHVHTDGLGVDGYLDMLTRQRAATIIRYLRQSGVTVTLEGVGHGAHQRIASDDTHWGRELNRRVEFQLIPAR